MLDHPIIDVALGLVLFFVVLSLVASAVQEWVATLCGLRAKNLRAGIQKLLGSEYAEKLYDHPLIKNLAKEKKIPSYIAPETMSMVLLEILAKENQGKSYAICDSDEVRELVNKISDDNPLKEVISVFVDSTENAATTLKSSIASWFDEGMSRVSGWYKRQVKLIIIVIATAVTVTTNASAVHIAEELWRNDALRAVIAAEAQAAAERQDVNAVNPGHLEKL